MVVSENGDMVKESIYGDQEQYTMDNGDKMRLTVRAVYGIVMEICTMGT